MRIWDPMNNNYKFSTEPIDYRTDWLMGIKNTIDIKIHLEGCYINFSFTTAVLIRQINFFRKRQTSKTS